MWCEGSKIREFIEPSMVEARPVISSRPGAPYAVSACGAFATRSQSKPIRENQLYKAGSLAGIKSLIADFVLSVLAGIRCPNAAGRRRGREIRLVLTLEACSNGLSWTCLPRSCQSTVLALNPPVLDFQVASEVLCRIVL